MLAKIWKKVCIAILVFACLFNVVSKLVHKVSFNKEILSSENFNKICNIIYNSIVKKSEFKVYFEY